MAELQGFYKIENHSGALIGPGGKGHGMIPITTVKASNMGIFSIKLAPDSNTYFISLIATPDGLLHDQLDLVNKKGLLYARVPGGVDEQRWFIKKTVDDNYVILDAQNISRWELQKPLPLVGIHPHQQVLCKDGLLEEGLDENTPTFWKLTRVSHLAAASQPLTTGNYLIKNVKNGPINAQAQDTTTDDLVVADSKPAVWHIEKLGGLLYQVHFLRGNDGDNAKGRPANESVNTLVLPSQNATSTEWLIHPLQLPHTYMIFRGTNIKAPIHWYLESNEPGTEVKVNTETTVGKKLTKVLQGKTSVAEEFKAGEEDNFEDCFWEITLPDLPLPV